MQRALLGAACALAAGMLAQAAAGGARMALLFALGVLLGAVLYATAFGFTSAWRDLFTTRDTTGVRAQVVMLAVATVLFAPVLAHGSFLGGEVAGALAPVGVQVAVGAFAFGLGMQLASGCGSGTLYMAGGGAPRMLIVLVFFVAGSFWASLHMQAWQKLPSWSAIALGEALGWPLALGLQLAVFALFWFALRRIDRATPGLRRDRAATSNRRSRLLVAGALALAVLNVLVLVTAGHPWTITWAFALWGAKAAQALGWNPESATFWAGGFQRSALAGGLLQDVTSLMNVGIMIGALAVSAATGGFRPQWRIPLQSVAAAALGGVAMGYGARIAFGCNVGAFFSGVASTSLHGWLWIAAALPGCWVGVRLRPWFGLEVARGNV